VLLPGESFTGTVTGSIFTWTNTNITIGLPSTGAGDISSFTATNGGTAPATGIITVTPSANGCNGTPVAFGITVNPTPTVTTPSTQEVCNGANTMAVSFGGPVSGTTYTWSNNNTSVGLANSGTGNIGAFPATNAGNTIATAVITVTPAANGCEGTDNSFEYIVNPTPNVTGTPTSQDVCNGLASAPITFSSNVSGTTFNWTNNAPGIGLGSLGSGNIATFTAVNITTTPETGVITVVPTAAYCAGAAETFTVTVNPTPVAMVPNSQSVCAGSATEAIYFSSNVSGTTYTWTNSDPGIGLGASGSRDSIASFIATNVTSVTAVGTITVRPTANGCVGAGENFNIVVNPNPTSPVINTEAPSAVCSNTMYQNFGTSVAPAAGNSYSWSVTNATLWQVGEGSQYSLVSFPSAGTAVVTLTSTVGSTGCLSQTSYSVTVSSSVADQPVMVYYNSYFVVLDYPAESYVWGYDDARTLDSTLIPGQSNEEYYNANPDFMNKYYWVITTNKSGCSQKTYYTVPTTNVTSSTKAGNEMNLYPNPAGNVLNITFTGAELDGVEARVFDMTGQQVAKLPVVKNTAAVDVDKLAPGAYSVGCYKDGVRISTGSFIKQ